MTKEIKNLFKELLTDEEFELFMKIIAGSGHLMEQ
jgi:hypothetical protein